ncbi:MAG: hypothetical protein WCP31_02430 [Chloroflexales bacterium]
MQLAQSELVLDGMGTIMARRGRPLRPIRNRSNDDVAGFVAWQARTYPLVGVAILASWLTLRGSLNLTTAWIGGPILVVALGFAVLPLVNLFLGQPAGRGVVSLPGCFIGQIVYWGSLVLGLPLLYWQGGVDLLAFGALLLPVFVVGLAIAASRMGH